MADDMFDVYVEVSDDQLSDDEVPGDGLNAFVFNDRFAQRLGDSLNRRVNHGEMLDTKEKATGAEAPPVALPDTPCPDNRVLPIIAPPIRTARNGRSPSAGMKLRPRSVLQPRRAFPPEVWCPPAPPKRKRQRSPAAEGERSHKANRGPVCSLCGDCLDEEGFDDNLKALGIVACCPDPHGERMGPDEEGPWMHTFIIPRRLFYKVLEKINMPMAREEGQAAGEPSGATMSLQPNGAATAVGPKTVVAQKALVAASGVAADKFGRCAGVAAPDGSRKMPTVAGALPQHPATSVALMRSGNRHSAPHPPRQRIAQSFLPQYGPGICWAIPQLPVVGVPAAVSQNQADLGSRLTNAQSYPDLALASRLNNAQSYPDLALASRLNNAQSYPDPALASRLTTANPNDALSCPSVRFCREAGRNEALTATLAQSPHLLLPQSNSDMVTSPLRSTTHPSLWQPLHLAENMRAALSQVANMGGMS